MKRKLTQFLLVLLASALFTLPARADGPLLCGTESNPSFICSAPAPPSPDFGDLALSLVADVLAIIP
jgi:hypothetical protein